MTLGKRVDARSAPGAQVIHDKSQGVSGNPLAAKGWFDENAANHPGVVVWRGAELDSELRERVAPPGLAPPDKGAIRANEVAVMNAAIKKGLAQHGVLFRCPGTPANPVWHPPRDALAPPICPGMQLSEGVDA